MIKKERMLKMGSFGDIWQRAEIASRHVARMEREYAEEIQASSLGTIIYDEKHEPESGQGDAASKISVRDADTVRAAFDCEPTAKIVLLNFANYFHPGGGFLLGATAQEESLCHASFLYSVLQKQSGFYEWNKEHANCGLYLNRALYSPDVRFFSGARSRLADVITCAAPNKWEVQEAGASEEENRQAFQSRIDFIVRIAAAHPCDCLILGAFGCGAFRQSSLAAAHYFGEALERHRPAASEVFFAIPHGPNFLPFKQRFEGKPLSDGTSV